MQCKAKAQSGKRCQAKALKNSEYCFTHDPATRQAQAQARKLGGMNRHTPHAGDIEAVKKSPRTIDESYSILDYALAETLAMDNSIQRNRLLVSIASQYIDARKVGEVETQLAELMRILASREVEKG